MYFWQIVIRAVAALQNKFLRVGGNCKSQRANFTALHYIVYFSFPDQPLDGNTGHGL